MNITHDDVLIYGFIITALFDTLYPTGTTLEQMALDAPAHGWIRGILESLATAKEMETAIDVSEVGM